MGFGPLLAFGAVLGGLGRGSGLGWLARGHGSWGVGLGLGVWGWSCAFSVSVGRGGFPHRPSFSGLRGFLRGGRACVPGMGGRGDGGPWLVLLALGVWFLGSILTSFPVCGSLPIDIISVQGLLGWASPWGFTASCPRLSVWPFCLGPRGPLSFSWTCSMLLFPCPQTFGVRLFWSPL